jgi:hypothetical protein
MSRILLAVPIFLCAALGFVGLERYRRAHCYGWTSGAMEPHWQRLFEWRRGDIYHDAKNVMSEWVRLDPQRAGKLFSFALSISLAANAGLILLK